MGAAMARPERAAERRYRGLEKGAAGIQETTDLFSRKVGR